MNAAEPDRDCALCPRLVAYRAGNRAAEPLWWNGPAPSFGAESARLLVLGLAPGRGGANRTGRPFTGDYAGDLLFATLLNYGFAEGIYRADPDDGLMLREAMITNAVRCAPPENKPSIDEIRACGGFLRARIATLPDLRAIVALGRIAHDSCLRALNLPLRTAPFAHGAVSDIAADGRRIRLFSSYHCSRYNTNTGVLTPEMFSGVFAAIRVFLDSEARQHIV